MANKKIRLAMALVFAIMAVGCKAKTESKPGGAVTLTNIPSRYDDKYAILVGYDESFDLFGCEKIDDWEEGIFTGSRISDGKATLPMWIVRDDDSIERYSGNHAVEVEVIIFDSATIIDDSEEIDGFEEDLVSFTNGSATMLWNNATSFTSQAPPTQPTSGGMPAAIVNAYRNTPEDMFVGIGSAKMATTSQSRIIAATRARQEIADSINSIIQERVRDYAATSKVDPAAVLAFQETVTATLSSSNLNGAVIQVEEPDSNGEWWVVVYLNTTSVIEEINYAVATAKLAVPMMDSFQFFVN